MNKEKDLLEKNFMSAVIYVHNAAGWITEFLDRLIRVLEENFEHSEMICVNDFSTDESVAKIREASGHAKTTAVSVLNMSYFHGVEVAMNAGVDLSIGDFVLEIDNTVQDYSMDEIMRVYRKVLEGNDIVSASANQKQKLSSRLFYWCYDKFTDGVSRMQTETFRILSRRAINRIGSMSRTVPYRKALYANCGLKIMNITYEAVPTGVRYPKDKRLKKYRGSLAVDTLVLFTDAGYFFSKCMTVLMMAVSLFMIVYTVVIYALAQPVAGWTTTILFLAAAFFGLFGILTVIIKYLQILIGLNFRRTKYSFESIEKLTK